MLIRVRYNSTTEVEASLFSTDPFIYSLGFSSISGDDAITKIVPRELFTYPNSTIKMGKEYGFYINIKPAYPVGCYSEVLVFDVIHDNGNDEEEPVQFTDPRSIEIRPLFEYAYAYLPNGMTATAVSVTHFEPNDADPIVSAYVIEHAVSNASGYVVALPLMLMVPIYLPLNRYYMSDITFSVALANKQALNQGDAAAGYAAAADPGLFIGATNYTAYGYTSLEPSTNPAQ